jgi:hypothetical protein
MCGCSFGGYSKSSSTACSGKSSKLEDSRNTLAILQNITNDQDLKVQYKELRLEIESILKEIYSEGTCPELSVVNAIVTEVENERTNYYNP